LCVITVSPVQLQTVEFVQYLYSTGGVLLCG
jgi:hypothetical protein